MAEWTIGLFDTHTKRWAIKPQTKRNLWLTNGRITMAQMVYGVTQTMVYQPFNIIEVGTSGGPLSHEDPGCLQPLGDRLPATLVTMQDTLVEIQAQFPAAQYQGDIVEAALYNQLQGGYALYRVVFDTPLPVTPGPTLVVPVVIRINVAGG